LRKIQFSDFQLDLELFQLTKEKKPIDIGRRALDLLVYLIENRDRVVELEELRHKVWDSAALSRSSIPTCVRELRIALHDDAENPGLIATARGRGYRFIGKLSGLHVDDDRDKPLAATIPFVGREAEMEAMQQCLREVVTEARCRFLLIRGEAGIGKTRLLSEFLESDLGDANSYVAASPDSGGAPAFWPWTQILREGLNKAASDNTELQDHAQILSSIFPEIQTSADLIHAKPASVDRHLILSQWAGAIRSISPNRPFVIAFEDIHRTDPDTLSLLSWITQELANEPLLIVATHRHLALTDTATTRLTALASTSNCETIDVPPLDAESITAMLDPLTENRERTGCALQNRTSGNAFYVTHLIRHLGHRLLSQSADAAISKMSPNGKEIVAHQLSDLPASTGRALSVASIIGSKFSAEMLAEILGESVVKILRDLEPAISAWFVSENGPDYSFTHSLLRDALYQTISSNERKEFHLAFAHSIRNRSGSLSRSAGIAEHLISAQPLGDGREAWHFSVLAGRESASRFAYSKAQSFLEAALSIDENRSIAAPDEKCNLMLELAESQLYSGDRLGARATVRIASEVARQAQSHVLQAECALKLSPDFLAIEVGTSDALLIRHLEEAISRVPNESKSLQARLLARLSQALHWSDEPDRSEQLSIRALQLARESGDQTALSAALSARAETLHGPDRLPERLDALTELGEVHRATTSIAQILVQRTRMISVLLELGDMARLDAENEACRQLALETSLPQFLWYPESMDAMRSLMSGRIDSTAETLAQRYREVDAMGHDVNVIQGYATQELFRLVELDKLDVALEMIQPLSEAYPNVRSWRAGLAWIQWLAGLTEEARDSIRAFDSVQLSALFREAGAGVGIATLAEVTAHVGSREQILAIYDRVRPISDRCAAAGYGVLYVGSYARYCGLLASALGHTEDAISYYSSAVGQEHTRGAHAWKGYSEIDLVLELYKKDPFDRQIEGALRNATATCNMVNTARLSRRFREMQHTIRQYSLTSPCE
jgi:DNA-binding winged helix-turn-helix (wHTH) protein/tetratricopeptide (TPR) repeat protein